MASFSFVDALPPQLRQAFNAYDLLQQLQSGGNPFAQPYASQQQQDQPTPDQSSPWGVNARAYIPADPFEAAAAQTRRRYGQAQARGSEGIAFPPADASGLPSMFGSPGMTSTVNAAPRAPDQAPDLPPAQVIGRSGLGPTDSGAYAPQPVGRSNIGPPLDLSNPVPTQQAPVPRAQNAAAGPDLSSLLSRVPQNPDINDKIQAGFANLFGGGSNSLMGMIYNSIQGFQTGMRTDPVGAQQQLQRNLFTALVANGVDQRKALLAVMSPEAFKAQIEQMNPKFGFGESGGVIYNTNPQTGQATPQFTAPRVMPVSTGQSLFQVQPGMPGASGAGGGQAMVTPLAAGPSVQQQAEQEARGKDLAALGNSINTDMRSAVNQKNVLARMAQLSDQAYSGPGAPAYQAVRSGLLATLGIPSSAVPAGEEFTALGNRAVLESLGGSLGRGISEGDRQYMNSAFPSLVNSAAGRKQMIQQLGKLADRKIEIGNLAQQYRQNNNNSLDGFDNYLAQWSAAHPLFSGQPGQGDGGWTQIAPGVRIRPKQ
jgi:hypothetical protein